MKGFQFFSVCLSLFGCTAMFSQQDLSTEVLLKQAPKLSYLDSIKQSFVNYEMSNCIDERWINELTNQDLFDEMYADVTKADMDTKVSFELSSDLLKERLKMLDQKSPFNVVHNQALENVIKSFLKNRPKSFERLMALSEFYFPMFEEHLAKYNLPLEIKYLAIVESALNPHAKSYVGATGLWQFMYATGKQYELEVNSYVDERSDPLKATDAACHYFMNMYKIFGDWDLVLASYNTGPGNVSKAIRRSGGYTNYWNIRPYLHKETQGYLPAFYATMYVYEYHKEHGINPKKAPMAFFETDTVMVKRKLSFDQVSELLDIPVNQIKFLNPIYKVNVIPYSSDKPHFLRLPKDKLATFQSNESKIYAYVDYLEDQKEKPFQKMNTAVASAPSNSNSKYETDYITSKKTKIHKVKRGEALSIVASKNNVSVAEIKKWNKLKSNSINAGQNLKIEYSAKVAVRKPKVNKVEEVVKKDAAEVKTAVASVAKPADTHVAKTNEKVAENNVSTSNAAVVTHTIARGETLDYIATKYKVSTSDLRSWNEINGNDIYAGNKLIVKSDVVVEHVEKAVAETSISDKVATKVAASTVKKSLANKVKEKERLYTVQSGDTLYKIASKIGCTVDNLKKTNNLKGEQIKPGQVLKING